MRLPGTYSPRPVLSQARTLHTGRRSASCSGTHWEVSSRLPSLEPRRRGRRGGVPRASAGVGGAGGWRSRGAGAARPASGAAGRTAFLPGGRRRRLREEHPGRDAAAAAELAGIGQRPRQHPRASGRAPHRLPADERAQSGQRRSCFRSSGTWRPQQMSQPRRETNAHTQTKPRSPEIEPSPPVPSPVTRGSEEPDFIPLRGKSAQRGPRGL